MDEQQRRQRGPATLIELALRAASRSSLWSVQRRSVDALPPDLANQLLAQLLARGAFEGAPHLLSRFSGCVTSLSIELRQPGELTVPPAQLVSYLAAFRHLDMLAIEGSRWLRDAHLTPLPSLSGTLQSLSLRGCAAVGAPKGGAATLAALRGLTSLQSLDLSLTGFRRGHLRLSKLLPPLAHLTSLSLAGLQLDDAACAGIAAAAGLRALDLSDAVVSHGFVEGELGALTRLTRLQLNWCDAGALPLFGSVKILELDHCRLGDVAHSVHGGEMRLERLSLAHVVADGLAAVALPEVLRVSAPTLQELILSHFQAVESSAHKQGPLDMLQHLNGAGQLRQLDLSYEPPPAHTGPGRPSPQPRAASPVPPLVALGMTRLMQLVAQGCAPVELVTMLEGLSSLRRLDTARPMQNAANVGLSAGLLDGFDDEQLMALTACRLSKLEHLDLSFNAALRGVFEGHGGLATSFQDDLQSGGAPCWAADGFAAAGPASGASGSSSIAQVPLASAAAVEVWCSFPALRSLRLRGVMLMTSRDALTGLAAALGGRLESLCVEGVNADSLAVLCQRAAALRELELWYSGLTAPDLERSIGKLKRLERLAFVQHNPVLLDVQRLAPLAARMRGCTVLFNGAAVGLPTIAAEAERSPGGARPRQRSGHGARQGDGHKNLAPYEQRRRYKRHVLQALAHSSATAASSSSVRAMIAEAELAGGGERMGILRTDW